MSDKNQLECDIQRYLDGMMSESEAAVFEAGLDDMLAEQSTEPDMVQMLSVLRDIPGEVPPPARVWQNIESRVATKSQPGRAWRTLEFRALAAAALLVVCGGLLYFLRPAQPRAGTVPNENAAVLSWQEECRMAERAYAEARAQLMSELDARRLQFSPETNEVLAKNLAVIDDAIREIRAAIDEDPANPKLMQMLLATREKEIRFLERLAQATNAS